jgi:hypothetical protein
MTRKRTKKLPHGNLKAVGNLKPGKRGVMGPTTRGMLAFGARGEVTSVLPVHYGTKPPHEYHPPPGGENAGLPENGPPGSEWWHQSPFNGRRG